ncbi:MAG: hypothetical protein CM15mP45_16340 [Deltaproteobacteria bacterium]|nr:MAG: hypothetical protein CM15mP45_16340 [Deltaproteobacteria bacterium]
MELQEVLVQVVLQVVRVQVDFRNFWLNGSGSSGADGNFGEHLFNMNLKLNYLRRPNEW